MPLLVGSRTVSAIAAATAASAALPPARSIRSPASAASGCEVATMFAASTGILCEGYGKSHLKSAITCTVPRCMPGRVPKTGDPRVSGGLLGPQRNSGLITATGASFRE